MRIEGQRGVGLLEALIALSLIGILFFEALSLQGRCLRANNASARQFGRRIEPYLWEVEDLDGCAEMIIGGLKLWECRKEDEELGQTVSQILIEGR